MDAYTIRETFLEFFEERDHRRYPSSSLIPNDPTLLLTNAGMVPFKPYFLGDAEPPHPRATSFQKAARTVDIDNVGHTTRHLTFFEMLGNFSFGDYFKREAIRWSYELAVDRFGLEPGRIWATCFEEDEESGRLWLEETDVPEERIQFLGADENFWSMGVAGPCGPCSELHYDRGEQWGEAGGPVVNGERYLELHNLVFMQSRRDDEGNILGELPNQNVDTGLGLERMAVIMQDVPTIFETDVFAPIMQRAQELAGTGYGADDGTDVSLRILAEHARTATVLIADGVLPAKDGRGYVLRRLLRRAVRHARLLGVETAVMPGMVDAVIETMGRGYPELAAQRELVERVVGAEEADFAETLEQGLAMLDTAVDQAQRDDRDALDGATAFKLHDTYGFPLDLTVEIADDAGLDVDHDEFERLMAEQRQRARAARGGDAGEVPADVYRDAAGAVGSVTFRGFQTTTAESDLGAIVTPAGLVDDAGEGEQVQIVLAETPFYAEGGGQVGDAGAIETSTGRLEVTDTQSPIEGLIVHRATVTAGEVATGQSATARVDAGRRAATSRSHSATHVLHATVRELLGSHAQQAGSLVEAGRVRFDFPHFDQVSGEQLRSIEQLVNERILADPGVEDAVMDIDEAKRAGAIALFGERYGQRVRVVTIGDFSKELCGGTHVGHGAQVGGFVIVGEESIGANQRRIQALTGADAYRHHARERVIAEEVAGLLDVAPDDAVERVRSLIERLRDAEREIDRARERALSSHARELADEVERAGGSDDSAIVAREVDVADADELRRLAFEVRDHVGRRAVIVLGRAGDGSKAQLVGVVSGDLVAAGVEARPILHAAAQVVGGGAGGSGELAQAGGRRADKLDEALTVAADEARRAIADR